MPPARGNKRRPVTKRKQKKRAAPKRGRVTKRKQKKQSSSSSKPKRVTQSRRKSKTSSLISNRLPFLRQLHTSNLQKQRQAVQKSANADVKALCECAFNILRKNVNLTPTQLAELRKPENTRLFYTLIDRGLSIDQKRRELVNQEGGVPLALVAPFIASLIGPAISKLGPAISKLIGR